METSLSLWKPMTNGSPLDRDQHSGRIGLAPKRTTGKEAAWLAAEVKKDSAS
jgi:hypothetical protein